ncbi:MAG TPA: hypothetical protein VLS89_18810, partial [Candidatus Nanopelagicales bacterium]|nr:hypothetical protein [Candidatus Nanopelagicales bacterium]
IDHGRRRATISAASKAERATRRTEDRPPRAGAVAALASQAGGVGPGRPCLGERVEAREERLVGGVGRFFRTRRRSPPRVVDSALVDACTGASPLELTSPLTVVVVSSDPVARLAMHGVPQPNLEEPYFLELR